MSHLCLVTICKTQSAKVVEKFLKTRNEGSIILITEKVEQQPNLVLCLICPIHKIYLAATHYLCSYIKVHVHFVLSLIERESLSTVLSACWATVPDSGIQSGFGACNLIFTAKKRKKKGEVGNNLSNFNPKSLYARKKPYTTPIIDT